MKSFAEWVCELSRRTNRSLAGSRVYVNPAQLSHNKVERAALLLCLSEWGMVPVPTRAEADFIWGALPANRQLSGAEAFQHAARHMPVTQQLAKCLADRAVLRDVRIAVSLVLEPKTSVFLEALLHAGASVGVYAPAAEVDQRMVEVLTQRGIRVEADASWTAEQDHQAALRLVDELHPQLIVDDGASFARLVALERPDSSSALLGVAEETTSGVRAFTAMEQAKELPWPVIAVNDSLLKTCFDNRHGTGETCVTATQALLGPNCFDGASVVVIGYGPVGEGFARRARALGARVTICDCNPVAALQARFAGFATCDLDTSLATADIVVSATGVRHTLRLEHLQRLREGASVVVVGGIAHEIALDDLPHDAFVERNPRGVSRIQVPQGHEIFLLADGDGVNYTAAGGNPIEVMDLSLAVQLAAVEYLITHQGNLPKRVLRLDDATERHLAQLALAARGASWNSDRSAQAPIFDWHITRFTDGG